MEIEKVGKGFENLMDKADVVFVSKEVCKSNGASNLGEAIETFKHKVRSDAILVCTWGEQGAACHTPKGANLDCKDIKC